MKKINIFLLILLTFTIQSCLKDDEDKFPVSAAERMEQRLIENEAALLSAANGWLMKYYPQEDQEYGGYNFFVKFKDENKVDVMSERGGSEKIVESFYSLTGDNGPVLRFDTHNELFHYFAEPKNPDGIGPADSGMQGDYEFMILEATPEKVTMKGKKTGNLIIMVPLQSQWSLAMDEILDLDNRINDFSTYIYEVNGFTAQVTRDYRNLSFTYKENEEVITEYMAYITTKVGIDLYVPLELGGVKVASFKFVEDSENAYFIDDETNAKLTVTAAPLNRQLVNGLWSFKYSKLGLFGKRGWDVFKEKLDERAVELHYAYLGSVSNQFAFYYLKGTSERSDLGYFNMSYDLIEDNRIAINWNGKGGGSYFWDAFLFKIGNFISLVSNQPTIKREFIITTDDPRKPTWLKLQDAKNPLNYFTLFKEDVKYPFEN